MVFLHALLCMESSPSGGCTKDAEFCTRLAKKWLTWTYFAVVDLASSSSRKTSRFYEMRSRFLSLRVSMYGPDGNFGLEGLRLWCFNVAILVCITCVCFNYKVPYIEASNHGLSTPFQWQPFKSWSPHRQTPLLNDNYEWLERLIVEKYREV